MTKHLYLIHEGQRIEIHAVTSDTHFSHRNIAKYTGRPFDNSVTTYAMDDALRRNWNQVVAEDETVLHLGDAALGKIEESLLSYEQVNGQTILIPGNHDEVSSVSRTKLAKKERLRPVYEQVFEIILPEIGVQLVAVSNGKERSLQASHYPSFGDSHDKGKIDRYADLRPDPKNGPIIHGHTHSHDAVGPDFPREFHVGVDAHGLSPLRAEKIVDWVFSL